MASDERRSGFRRRNRWLVGSGALLLGLLVAEVALRVVRPQPDPNAGVLQPIVHDRFVVGLHTPQATVFAPDPKILAGLSSRTTFTINQFGFRSPRLTSLAKPPGSVRVFAVGGSTTECLYLDDAEAWPERVQAALAGEIPGLDVVNTGHSGDSTREHLALLAHRVAAFAPDVVLFLVGANDVDLHLRPDYAPAGGDARSRLRHRRPSPTQGFLAKWTRVSHLARGLTWLVRGGPPAEVAGNPVQDGYGAWMITARKRLQALPERRVEVGGSPPLEYERNLRSLIAVARAQGASPVLVTQPAMWGAPGGAWEQTLWVRPRPDVRIPHAQLWELLEAVNDVSRRLAQELKLPLIDLARILPKDPRFFYDDDHFTVAGAIEVGRIVAEGLREQGVVKRLRSGRTTPGE